jgi:uncharacterized membrane protein/nitrite reductase/ring-hydroxylating ferredoxin subunit
MRSRANIRTHPLHPILICFPIAFFTATLVLDLLYWIRRNGTLESTAHYLLIAGIIMGLIAAVPGFVDFRYTVPPASSGKKRAATHGLINLCMLALFALALLFREQPGPGVVPFVLEAAGFVLMLVAGWLGGTLVHRNQIGIDQRYAFAGKWKEEFVEEKNGVIELGDGSDLKRDQMKLIHVGDKRLVLARTEGGFVVFSDHCTHRGGSLAGGVIICGTVQCPWHGSQFDGRTGEVKAGPAGKKITTYSVQMVGGKIQVNIAS